MTGRRTAAWIVAVAACWDGQALAQQAPMPTFDHRQLIKDNLGKLFSADAQARNIQVSEIRRVNSPVGLTWAACVRVSATSMTGSAIAPRTYAVTFTTRNDIAERREAKGADCADAKFQQLK